MAAILGRNGMGNDAHAVCMMHCDGANAGTTFLDSTATASTANYTGALTEANYLLLGDATKIRCAAYITLNGTIKSASCYFQKNGSPTGTITCVVRKDSDDSIIATSPTTLDASTISTGSYTQYTFTFDNPVPNIAVRVSWEKTAQDASNYVKVALKDGGTPNVANDYDTGWNQYGGAYAISGTITLSSARAWTASGAATTQTAVKMFGTASYYSPNTSPAEDYVGTADSADFDLFVSGKPFTMDFWLRRLSQANGCIPYSQYQDASNYVNIMAIESGGNYSIQWYGMGGSLYLLTGNVGTENQWDHWALVWDGSTAKIYINGKNTPLSETSTAAVQITGDVRVGGGQYFNAAYYPFNGWIDEFRLSQGIERWKTDFNVPMREN